MSSRRGYIAGEPIKWHTGPSASEHHRSILAVVWVGGTVHMHSRMMPVKTLKIGHELWRARLRRELNDAEDELRRRVHGRPRYA